jgi:hypothetical protein
MLQPAGLLANSIMQTQWIIYKVYKIPQFPDEDDMESWDWLSPIWNVHQADVHENVVDIQAQINTSTVVSSSHLLNGTNPLEKYIA